MGRDKLLLVLTFLGSAICWWPAIVEPSLDFSRWILLGLIALMAAAATALSEGRWLRFVLASVAGSFAGLFSGILMWPSHDGIANTYSGIALAVGTLAAAVAALAAGVAASLVVRKAPGLNPALRRILWLAMACCVAFGPVALALTPPLVARRVARNDALAEKRFTALKSAVEQTWAEPGGADRLCDAQRVMKQYSGPEFTNDDWTRIVGNYVEQDGYVYMVYCHEKNGYTIDVQTKRQAVYGYGSRTFCTDESKRIGCGSVWDRSRNACKPCDS